MKKTKNFRLGIAIIATLCILVTVCVLVFAFLHKKSNPGTDFEKIKAHLSQYGNDHEELALIDDLAVLHHHPRWKKLEPWYAFMKKVRAGKTAWIDMVDYTDEGDSIFYYLHYDGTEFLLVEDTTRDQFGTPLYTQEKFTRLYEFAEETENGSKQYSAVLSNCELYSKKHAEEVFWDVYAEWEAGEFDPSTVEYQRFPRTLFWTEIE